MHFVHGVVAFTNSIQGVSLWALRRGFAEVGVGDNDFLLFSDLMDATSLFLTANADTVYFWGNISLADGPMVMEAPPNTLGVIDDFWFRWVGDIGMPGPDRGQGVGTCSCRTRTRGHCPKAGTSCTGHGPVW